MIVIQGKLRARWASPHGLYSHLMKQQFNKQEVMWCHRHGVDKQINNLVTGCNMIQSIGTIKKFLNIVIIIST